MLPDGIIRKPTAVVPAVIIVRWVRIHRDGVAVAVVDRGSINDGRRGRRYRDIIAVAAHPVSDAIIGRVVVATPIIAVGPALGEHNDQYDEGRHQKEKCDLE